MFFFCFLLLFFTFAAAPPSHACRKKRAQFAWHSVFARATSTDYSGLMDPSVTSFQDVVPALFLAASRENARMALPPDLLKLGLQQKKEHVRNKQHNVVVWDGDILFTPGKVYP